MEELPENVYYDTKVSLNPSDNEKYITAPKLTDCEGNSRVQGYFQRLLEAHVHGNIPQAASAFAGSLVSEDYVGNTYVRKLQEYIQGHYIEGFDASDVEAACGLSYKYAGTLFKEAVGETIREYQRTLRIRRAKQLLTETDRPVTEIAQLCGFSDVFYFSKVFRAQQGSAPSEYRRTYIPGI